ncbi:MAG: hypothetical protein ACTSQZ_03090 [Candidatus Thorarchaeota archaeon]
MITMVLLRKRLMLPIGIISLAIAGLIYIFSPQDRLSDFIIGVLVGMSCILNMAGIYYTSRTLKSPI